jgi:hypothetical protein
MLRFLNVRSNWLAGLLALSAALACVEPNGFVLEALFPEGLTSGQLVLAQESEPAADKPTEQPGDQAAQEPTTNPEQAARRELQRELARLRNREMRPRREINIVSPLDLPTPNDARSAIGLPGPGYWQQHADYQMEVTLDDEADTLVGRETITYTNNSPTPLPYLWLNLEQNLFRSDSDGSKFTPRASRFNNIGEFEGGYTIEFVRIAGQDLNLEVFDTVGRVMLPNSIEPRGGQIQLEVGWRFNIPSYGADRMGIQFVEQGKIYEMAQWFPSVCKFDDVNGWNNLPYLGQGEFYTDFGTYDVKITAPRGHVVCATGVLQNPTEVLTPAQQERLTQAKQSAQTVMIRTQEEVGTAEAAPAGEGPLTWHFKADKVRTFAWTSSQATIWDAAGITWDDGTTVLCQSVYPKESLQTWPESTQMLRHSVLLYSEQWFRYPYPTVTNASGVCGGMEYPMVLFCSDDFSKAGLFAVTSHELGHTWFPMVVNTDERRYPWMDEGFNTFINFYDRFEVYNADINGQPLANREESGPPSGRGRGNSTLVNQPIALPADQLRPDRLGRLAYFKPGNGMRLLREVILGPERFDPAFKLYIREWAFKSPQPADFFRCMENAAGMNLAWFWRGWFLEDNLCDQAITSVTTGRDSDSVRIQIANKQEMVMPVFLRVEFEDKTTKDVELPVYVWYYTNLWSADVPTEGKSVAKVTLDPRRNIPDADRSNNSWNAPKAEKDAGESSEEKPKAEGGGEGDGEGDGGDDDRR